MSYWFEIEGPSHVVDGLDPSVVEIGRDRGRVIVRTLVDVAERLAMAGRDNRTYEVTVRRVRDAGQGDR